MSRLGQTRRTVVLAITATLLLAGGGSAAFAPDVVGGSTASAGSFPWLAFVYDYEPGGVGFCTGTVISPNVILTAGHCVLSETTGRPLPARDFGVATGTVDWTKARGRSLSGVTRVILNPSFDDATGRDDAALLVLGTRTPAPALPLASEANRSSSASGSVAVFAGWGQTRGSDSMSTANTLQWARTVIKAPAYCQSNISPFDPGAQLCADDAPRWDTSACFGDSGGPLIANGPPGQSGAPLEIGIIRSSAGSCDPTGDGVFTAVVAISSWAESEVTAHANDAPVASTAPPLPFAVALARLPIATVKEYVQQVLSRRFGAPFRDRATYADRCSERSAYRVRCAVGWDFGPGDYTGVVSVFYAVSRGSAVWSDHYVITRVDDGCDPHRAHVALFRVARASGSYPKPYTPSPRTVSDPDPIRGRSELGGNGDGRPGYRQHRGRRVTGRAGRRCTRRWRAMRSRQARERYGWP
jgi:secreted trypsin-like serine protease